MIAIDQTQAQPDEAAIGAALTVLDRFMVALNSRDEPALLATLHFPHYRLTGGEMRVWDRPAAYLGDFFARTGADWQHSERDFRKVIAPTIRRLVHSDPYGSSLNLMAAGPWRRDRASRIDLQNGRPRGLNVIATERAGWAPYHHLSPRL
jgi:hypothetical protein